MTDHCCHTVSNDDTPSSEKMSPACCYLYFFSLLFQALARHSTTDRERDQRKQRRVQKEVESKDDQDDSASVTSSIQSTEASSVANDPTILDEK